MKNAGKACNNRLYRHIRTFEKIVKNYFVIYTTQIKRKAGTEICSGPCFHYTIDERRDSCFRKGRKCERNPSGVSFAFNSRPQATVCAAERFRTNKKRHAEACLFLLCFHYTIDEHTSCRSDSDQLQNQARFCKNVFSAIRITKSRSSGSAFAKSI